MSVATPGPEDLQRVARLAGLEISERDLADTIHSIERILAFMGGMTDIDDTVHDAREGPDGPGHLPLPDTVVSAPSMSIDVTRFAPQVQDGLILCPPVPRQTDPPA